MNSMDLARRLRSLRGNQSRQGAARDLGISIQALTAYEQGERRPRDEILQRIAGCYGVPTAYLRGERPHFLPRECTNCEQ